MTIHFACSSCNTPNQAEDRLAGRTLKCFTCGALFVVPDAPPPVIEPAPVAVFEPVAGLDAAPVAALAPSSPFEMGSEEIEAVPAMGHLADFVPDDQTPLAAYDSPPTPELGGMDNFFEEPAAIVPVGEDGSPEDIDISALLEEMPQQSRSAAPTQLANDLAFPDLEMEALAPAEDELAFLDLDDEKPE